MSAGVQGGHMGGGPSMQTAPKGIPQPQQPWAAKGTPVMPQTPQPPTAPLGGPKPGGMPAGGQTK